MNTVRHTPCSAEITVSAPPCTFPKLRKELWTTTRPPDRPSRARPAAILSLVRASMRGCEMKSAGITTSHAQGQQIVRHGEKACVDHLVVHAEQENIVKIPLPQSAQLLSAFPVHVSDP